MTEPRLILGDCLDALRELPDASVDSVVTDPPYGIGFMGKAWDVARIQHEQARRRALARDASEGGDFGNGAQSAGIYDVSGSGNRAFQAWVEEWGRELVRVLKPGGHALVFGGTRTFHRLASGLEDAGFEVRDTLAWMYGSGFPKSHDVAKAIDAREGAEGGWRQEDHFSGRGGSRAPSAQAVGGGARIGQLNHRSDENPEGERFLYEPESDAAREWQGWGTALKPAFEPVVVARKPPGQTVAASVLEHGTGAINVDACRIPIGDEQVSTPQSDPSARAGVVGSDLGISGASAEAFQRAQRESAERTQRLGRWPANVLLSHDPDCVPVGVRRVASNGHFPAARPSGSDLAGASGHVGQDGLEERHTRGELVEEWNCAPGCPVRLLDEQTGELTSGRLGVVESPKRNDVFGRFAHANLTPYEPSSGGASRFFYCAKVSRAERNAGLDGFDPLPLHWSSGDANPGSFQADGTDRTARNPHPTVKPVALMRWLIRLVTPPGGTVLDPFMGSGTTGIAAALEGMRFVGVEREPDYMQVAEARIRWWAAHGEQALDDAADLDRAVRDRQAIADAGQLDLFGVTPA